MNIIIEGLDKVGKTTLVKNLEKEGYNAYRVVRPNLVIMDLKSPSDENKIYSFTIRIQLETIAEMIERGIVKNTVFDRFHFSEFAYYDEWENKDLSYLFTIDKKIKDSSILILLYRPLEENYQMLDELEKEKYDFKMFSRYYTRYFEFFQKSQLRKLSLEVTNLDPKQTFEKVIRFIREDKTNETLCRNQF